MYVVIMYDMHHMDFTRGSYHSHNVLQKSVNEDVEVTVKGEIEENQDQHRAKMLK